MKARDTERDSMSEEWRAIPGFEGCYECSDKGRVRSLDRYVTGKDGIPKFMKGLVLRTHINTGGYPNVRLGRARMIMIHTVVALAFVGERPDGTQICHNDSDKTNNAPSNLRYDTPKMNQFDRRANGTHIEGERVWLSKLTTEQVREIKALILAGVAHLDIGERFGVCRSNIALIAKGKNWKHV